MYVACSGVNTPESTLAPVGSTPTSRCKSVRECSADPAASVGEAGTQNEVQLIVTPHTDGLDTVPNPERGCGFLKEGKAYLRSDVSPDGVLPAFVEFDTPIPFLEGHFRGYSHFPGVQFETATVPTTDGYLNVGDGVGAGDVMNAMEPTAVRDFPDVIDALRSVTPTGEWQTREDPPLEGRRHVERLKTDADRGHPGVAGQHVGELRVARSHDLLMHVGASYYPEPSDFIDECKTHGLSKAIPVSETQEPPVINPGRTRVFIVHPTAVPAAGGSYDVTEESTAGVPGIIGYAYVTRCIYTATTVNGRPEFPEWAEEHADSGRMDLVEIGEREPEETHENGATLADWAGEGDDTPEDDDADSDGSAAASDYVPPGAGEGPPHPHDQSDAAYNRNRHDDDPVERDPTAAAVDNLMKHGNYQQMYSAVAGADDAVDLPTNPSKADLAVALVDYGRRLTTRRAGGAA